MEIKNRSGKSPLLALYKRKTPLFYRLCAALVLVAELSVMYIIQNNFQNERLKALGLFLLALSLLISGFSLSLCFKRINNKSQ